MATEGTGCREPDGAGHAEDGAGYRAPLLFWAADWPLSRGDSSLLPRRATATGRVTAVALLSAGFAAAAKRLAGGASAASSAPRDAPAASRRWCACAAATAAAFLMPRSAATI